MFCVFCLQVTASDQDGPSNSLLRYSVVSGDPLHHFSIHPRSGEISVSAALDREEVCLHPGSLIGHHSPEARASPVSPLQVSHYSLTVQAADGGDPPLSSATLVTITVADVNDNPPVFDRVNRSLLLQVRASTSASASARGRSGVEPRPRPGAVLPDGCSPWKWKRAAWSCCLVEPSCKLLYE